MQYNEFCLNNNFYDSYKRALNVVNMLVNDYINNNKDHDVVAYVNKRLKTEESIKGKLKRNNFEYSEDGARDNLRDIAGIRVVCPFVKDLNDIRDYLRNNPYIYNVLIEKDYISNPKPTGYRSYHMIVNVIDTVNDGDVINLVPVEIQLRTLAMDLYASLEHRLRYKNKYSSFYLEEMNNKLKRAYEKILEIDDESSKMIRLSRSFEDNIDNEIELDFDRRKFAYAKKKLKSVVREIEKDLNSGDYKILEATKVRLKSDKSIKRKMISRGKSIDDINDIVAARFICPFISDLDIVIEKIINNSEFKIVGYKDYINNPKDNGYSSFHILIEIPVFMNGKSDVVKAEIQVRTIVQNMWASLHHRLCYENNDTSSEVATMLKKWACDLREIDKDYNYIYNNYKFIKNNDIKRKILKK